MTSSSHSIKNVVFYLGVGALFTHEMDAVPNHEWRGLPLLQAFPDETAMVVFVAAHVPLFAILIGLIASRNARVREISCLAIGAFLAVHGLLHALSIGEEAYEFTSPLSNLLIFGGAFLGATFLVLEAKHRFSERRRSPAA